MSNFECGEGWNSIINNVISLVDRKIKSRFEWMELVTPDEKGHICAPCSVQPKILWLQIKEKFGGLRMYYSIERNDKYLPKMFNKKRYNKEVDILRGFVDGVIAYAETVAQKTCEVSGEVGTLRRKGIWLKVVSDKIAKEQGWEEFNSSEQVEAQ